MNRTRKHTVEQNNVVPVAGLQLELHEIVLAVARHCENKKSFVCVGVCPGSALQQNVGMFAGQDGPLPRIVELNVWQNLLLRRLLHAIGNPLSLMLFYEGKEKAKTQANTED